ncbi:MAG: sulfotransferase [Gammaproteobacteria bacterium]
MLQSPDLQRLESLIRQAYARTWLHRDSELEAMEKLHGQLNPASRDAIVLGFALAKISDDLGETGRCVGYLQQANRYHRVGKTDTIDDARVSVAKVREIFSAPADISLPETDELQPLFVLGMPRSGTTLVEQILATHSQVYGGGELKFMGQWCFGYVKLFSQYGSRAPLENYLPQLRDHYLQSVRQLTPARFVSDKMPVNFLWLGFILSAFPNARIIHTMRDPMAVCWSIYKTPFAGTSNGYACDLEEIGEFYRLYYELMEFWKARYGARIHDLNYERLTLNQEQETRSLLDYCGLGWEDACLEFYRNTREVNTVSRDQVKRPMYQAVRMHETL